MDPIRRILRALRRALPPTGSQQHAWRHALLLALDGIDVGPRVIHGMQVTG